MVVSRSIAKGHSDQLRSLRHPDQPRNNIVHGLSDYPEQRSVPTLGRRSLQAGAGQDVHWRLWGDIRRSARVWEGTLEAAGTSPNAETKGGRLAKTGLNPGVARKREGPPALKNRRAVEKYWRRRENERIRSNSLGKVVEAAGVEREIGVSLTY